MEEGPKYLKIKTSDAHLYYVGEEIKVLVDGNIVTSEVVRVVGDTVFFRPLQNDVDIEELILAWRESHRR